MRSKILYIVAVIAISLGAISCSGIADDPGAELDVMSQQAKSDQVTKTINLTVVIDDKYNGQFLYKIEVFNNAPSVSNSVLLKSGVGSRDLVFSSRITVADNQQLIYIRQTDPTNKQTIKQISITSNEVICDFR